MAVLAQSSFFLSEIIGRRFSDRQKRLGRLADMIIAERGPVPEVTHLVINRPFGYATLYVPWDKVMMISPDEIVAGIDDPSTFEREPNAGQILLRDYVLDKKVLDLDDSEVEVVYDVKLAAKDGRLYASEVDLSKIGILRRLGLHSLARRLAARSQDGTLSWRYIQPLPGELGSFSGSVKLRVLKEKLSEIHPVDLADMLEELDEKQRVALFNQLETEQAADTLEEIEPRVQRHLIAASKKERVAELIDQMTPAQAADVLAILPAAESDEILNLIDPERAAKVRELVRKHEENILLFVTTKFIRLPPETRVGDAIERYRSLARDVDVIMYIYVVAPGDKLLGVVDLHELLLADPGQSLGSIMTSNPIALEPADSLLEASRLFTRYGFRAIPVVENEGVVLGVIPFSDIMNIEHRFV